MPIELTREIRELRVAIARDMIAQLDANRVHLTTGYYLRYFRDYVNLTGDLRDHLAVIQEHCDPCLLGFALLSKARVRAVPMARLVAGVVSYAHMDRETVVELLADVFDADTLTLMECVFEGRTFQATPGPTRTTRSSRPASSTAGSSLTNLALVPWRRS